MQRLAFVHDNYCELKSALNLKAEEEALERENPFEEMHKSVLTAGKAATGEIEGAQEDAEGFSDGDEDLVEEEPENVVELSDDDFGNVEESES